MSKRGLPESVRMRHDAHYVDTLTASAGTPVGRMVPIELIDPNPDPATSWVERDRMFKVPRSSWQDYDASKISKGGAAPTTLPVARMCCTRTDTSRS